MRIVSLLPSTTEILFAVGAGDDVVGVTFECDFPPQARSRRIVSTSALPNHLQPAEIDAEVRARMAAGEDLYHLDEDALRDLAPDLVITQDLCAVCAVDVATVDAALDHLGCDGKVLTVDPATLDDVLDSITGIGRRRPRSQSGSSRPPWPKITTTDDALGRSALLDGCCIENEIGSLHLGMCPVAGSTSNRAPGMAAA